MHDYQIMAALRHKGPSEFARRLLCETGIVDRTTSRAKVEAMKTDGSYQRIAQEVLDA